MIVGCYSLHLYCDTPGCPMGRCAPSSDGIGRAPGEFTHDKNETGAIAKARRAGWKINLGYGTCFCPTCSKRPRP